MSASPGKIASTSFLILTFLIIAGCQAPPGDQEAGRKWFVMNNCSSCHGPNAHDGRAVPIAGLQMSFGSFVRKLRTADAPIMPQFPESVVSEQDAADIYAFLKNQKKPEMSKH